MFWAWTLWLWENLAVMCGSGESDLPHWSKFLLPLYPLLSLIQVFKRSFPSHVWGLLSPPVGMFSIITLPPCHSTHKLLPAHICWAGLHRKTRIGWIQLPTCKNPSIASASISPRHALTCGVAHFHYRITLGTCKFFLEFHLALLPHSGLISTIPVYVRHMEWNFYF